MNQNLLDAKDGSLMHVVCLVLVNERGDVLAVRRPEGKRMAGCWEFPGGKMEAGESREEALRREIREELHLELEELEPLRCVTHRYDFATVHLIPYLGRATDPQFHLAEHDEFRWLSPADLFSVPWAPADLPILRQVRSCVIPALPCPVHGDGEAADRLSPPAAE